jgi:PAS domain S-box-containing protein
MQSYFAHAGLVEYFKEEDGSTNWQYLANWSSGILIIILSFVLINLYVSHRRARKANKALEEIKSVLEQRVLERTATLDQSNQLLTETNVLLEGEVIKHKNTTKLLRLSETYIKDILESMPLMLIGVNKEMTVTQWNKCAETFTGLSGEEAKGRNLWEAYPTITLSPNQVTNVIEKNAPVTIKHCQRGQYYFDITVYPLSEHGVSGAVILVDNVTQRILAENMLIQRDKMSSMGELASTMAHDINTPLQAILHDLEAIKLNAYKALETTDSESLQDIAALLSDAAERGKQASGVINNLLNFSGAHGQNQKLASITDVIDHSLDLAKDVLSDISGFKFRDIAIERHYEKNLPQVPCYVPELQQVFFSLFRHACHALAEANKHEDFQPKIRIDMMECYDALWIKIQHNGKGLNTDEQQYIFEPFFNKATSEEMVDASKRLSFSYFIITEHHKGHMAVTSDVSVGTTFHIQLQLKVPGFNKPLQHP